MVISTSGIGVVRKGEAIRDSTLNVGDKIIISGSVGDHGMALMSHREGFEFETDLKSDVAPVWNVVDEALKVGGVTAMKDPTRGGLANAINEMANKSKVSVKLIDDAIPVKKEVNAISEMLGIDPYEVANEGKVLMGVKNDLADETLKSIKKTKYGKDAAIIGEVTEGHHVIVTTSIGGERIMEIPIADPVPRVC
jgi:hydrogenase expression/formation protein HypE